jgi:hypothetical protein
VTDVLIKQGTALSLSTLAFLVLFKGLAWSISLGNFRDGPTFPALFTGAAAGLLAAHLPGFSETPAVAVLMAAAAVSILELPLSATIITLLLTSKAGIATAPLIIVAVVVWTPTGFVDTIRSGTMVYEERTGSGTGSQEVHPGI